MKGVFTNSERIFPANSWLKIFYISSFAVKHFLSHCTIVCFQNELLKWSESLLPFFSTLASFSLCPDLEVLRHLPSSASNSALTARNDMFLLPFALLPAAFSTFPTWKTLMLRLVLWLLHSGKFLSGHYSYQYLLHFLAWHLGDHFPFHSHFLLAASKQHFSFCFLNTSSQSFSS